MGAQVVVSCAADMGLAEVLYDYLKSKLPSSNYSLSIDKDEVGIISEESVINNNAIRQHLDDFIKANPNLSGYSVTQFENVFTIGITHNLDRAILTCEMCGYLTLSEDDLLIHKRVHAIL
jgi:hypothetical protein